MPVQPTFPGVYIEEIPSGVHTITGVATSIAAFLGRASKGRMNKAVRILSLSDYIRTFGNPYPMSDLANSVRLFFANGGTDCYVIRLANNASKAAVTLRSLEGQEVLVATAKSEGVWGDTVRLEVDYKTPNPDDSFNLRVIHEEGGIAVVNEAFPNLSMNPSSPRFAPNFVMQSSELIELELATAVVSDLPDVSTSFAGFSLGRRSLGANPASVQSLFNDLINPAAPDIPRARFNVSVNGSPFVVVDLRPWTVPAAIATMETDLRDKINAALAAFSPAPTVTCSLAAPTANIGHLLRITSANGDRSGVRIRSAASNDIAASLMLGVDQGGIEPARWSNFRPAPTATFLLLGIVTPGVSPAPGDLDMTNLNNIADLQQSDITAISIDGVNVPLNSTEFNLTTTVGTHRWFISAPVAGSPHDDNDGVREKLRIIAGAINSTAGLPWRAEVWGYHLAIIASSGTINQQPAITITPTNLTTGNFLNALIENVRQYTLGTSGTGAFSTAGVPGSDGAAPTEADYVGNPLAQTGFHALDPVDLFNLMVIPADEEVTEATYLNLLGPASNYCAQHRAFFLVDGPASWTRNGRPKVVEDPSLVDSDVRRRAVKANSAVFYPRLSYSDNGLRRLIGPAGAIAGLMARIDSTRGVWKAPAGTEADLRGILGLELNLTDPENGVLNKIAVNCLRSFPTGFVNWGARTLDGSDDFASEWKYVPIRRLALFLEESLFRGTKWVVFEPNDEPLWAKIRLNLNAFMMSLFRQSAFQGTTPDKAFFVKCDAETTTQDDRNKGIVNIIVGFAPLKPAEFVIIKIQQIAGEL